MALVPGSKLGPYEIVGPLGAGGMGEVYRARDTRLERTVAIKILPAHLSSDPLRRQRFEREAKTISSLNHPHICVLHDVGHQDGIDYLVMECVEGETLAKRLEKGPLPLEQVLKYGAQIADALDNAHRSGVVHRDLKPGNIMLTATGAKLLDFGLAKPAVAAASLATLTAAATQDSPVTEQGTIVGTFQYMSPEQVEGKEVDGRSDIFSLGAVLYEMLTGRRAFEGKSRLSVASAILEKEPAPISAVKPLTPPVLDHAIKKCLAKLPDERWQSASDLSSELKWMAEGGSQTTSLSSSAARGGYGRRALMLRVGALLLGAAITGLAIWNLKPTLPRPITRTVITLPPGQRLAGLDQTAVALSPDGTHLAYVALQGGTQQLYLRAMDSLEARPIPGTEGASEPFFSPDGQWIGFFTVGNLKKVSVSGGAVVTLGNAGTSFGGSWGSQGTIVFAPRTGSPLLQVSDAGGTQQPVSRLEKGESLHIWPQFLPGGKAVLFTAGNSAVDSQIAIQSIATGERRNLISGMQPYYAASGHLIYAQGGTLMAASFDPRRLEIKGTPVSVVEGVAYSVSLASSQYSISDNGSLVYVSGGAKANQRRMVWVSRNGAEQPLPAPPQAYEIVRVSPDGRRVAVELDEQFWLYDLARDTLTRFTFEGSRNQNPVWTPDGRRIAFFSTKEGPGNLFWQLADGSGGLERLGTSQYVQIPRSWSPDRQLLAFDEINPKTQYDIWVLRMSDHKAQPFLQTPFSEGGATFSPDGHWMAYVSNESGRPEVYVQAYPGPGGKWQISTGSGTEPAWNHNGKELFYRTGNKMMAVDVTPQPSFSAGKPHMLFEGQYFTSDWPLISTAYDVSADGQRFLMVKATEQASSATQVNVVLNWFEELKRRVPTGKK